jgi:hypothetical protein
MIHTNPINIAAICIENNRLKFKKNDGFMGLGF